MSWLDVPHLRQSEPGWCLPACVAMVAAYWQQPVTQADVARWLETRGGGTPAGRIQQMSQRGFEVTYNTGSLADLETWLQRQIPPILFIRTGDGVESCPQTYMHPDCWVGQHILNFLDLWFWPAHRHRQAIFAGLAYRS